MVNRIRRIPFLVFVVLIIGAIVVLFFSYKNFYKAQYPIHYEEYVKEYCQEYEVEPSLIYAIMRTESSFNHQAVSQVGAKGLMQMTDDTYRWVQGKLHGKEKYDPQTVFDPQINIQHGVYLIKLYEDEFYSQEAILAAYHAGRTRVNEWLKDSRYSKDGKHLHTIPFADTKAYVEKTLETKVIYEKLYN